LKPEEKARQHIDELLTKAGWVIQNYKDMDLGAATGVVLREFPLKKGFCRLYAFIDRQAVGVVEAKPEGVTLSAVAEQDEKYIRFVPEKLPHVSSPLPFAYESTGIETFFRDLRDPDTRSREFSHSTSRKHSKRFWETQKL